MIMRDTIKGFMKKVIVVGGGASGMMSAYFSSFKGNKVLLIEKNEKLGKKIYITGKGRCNLTNDTLPLNFFDNVATNPKFLYKAIYDFTPQQTMQFFEENGLQLKVERGNRVFPFSDKASDVTKTLEKLLYKSNLEVTLNDTVLNIKTQDNKVVGVNTSFGFEECDSVIICTGGVSYPLTGSTGDGYDFAKSVGHTLVPCKSALVGIELNGNEFLQLQGLSLKNVTLTATVKGRKVFSDFGEMLFTHFGVSGPIVLSCSSVINKYNQETISLSVDLKPALSYEKLNDRLLREFKENNDKILFTVMRSLLPKTLIDTVLLRAKVKGNKNCSEITVEERKNIISSLKNLDFTVKRLRPIEEAIVTSGGVSIKEINPSTMESKIIKGLFFAGEVLDIDCFTGGFNLQAAFSMGKLAGINS